MVFNVIVDLLPIQHLFCRISSLRSNQRAIKDYNIMLTTSANLIISSNNEQNNDIHK